MEKAWWFIGEDRSSGNLKKLFQDASISHLALFFSGFLLGSTSDDSDDKN
jgi:hypothetical protein